MSSGVEQWNASRRASPGIVPDLGGANLRQADLSAATLRKTDLREAELHEANLRE